MRKLMLLLVLLSLYSIGLADEIITMGNGKKVILKDNGTWNYAISPESKTAETYKDMSLTDLKLDIDSLDRKKIKTQAFAEMFDFILTIRQDAMDTMPLSVNINKLSQQERTYLHTECNKGCTLTVYGRVGDVMYNEKGIIADKIEW